MIRLLIFSIDALIVIGVILLILKTYEMGKKEGEKDARGRKKHR